MLKILNIQKIKEKIVLDKKKCFKLNLVVLWNSKKYIKKLIIKYFLHPFDFNIFINRNIEIVSRKLKFKKILTDL